MQTTKVKLVSQIDRIPLGVMLCRPEGAAKAVVQLAHGMCERKERYMEFMEYLCSLGYVCVIHDHRGHGRASAHRKITDIFMKAAPMPR